MAREPDKLGSCLPHTARQHQTSPLNNTTSLASKMFRAHHLLIPCSTGIHFYDGRLTAQEHKGHMLMMEAKWAPGRVACSFELLL